MPASEMADETAAAPPVVRTNRDPFVYVLGTPGSGAEVVSRVLGVMGLDRPGEVASNGAPGWTPEQTRPSAAQLNQAILERLGGTWSAPPRLPDEWQQDISLEPFRDRARSLAGAWSGGRALCWFDPLNCLLVSFWRGVIARPSGAIVVYREPSGTAFCGRGLERVHAAALWERYNRNALGSLEGLPVMVVDYDEASSDPRAFIEEASLFTRSIGCPLAGVPALEEAARLVESQRQAQRAARGAPGGGDAVAAGGARAVSGTADGPEGHEALLSSQVALLDTLHRARGTTGSWAAPSLGGESPWVEALLSARRREERLSVEVGQLDRALDWTVGELEQLPAPEEDEPPEPVPLTAAQDSERYTEWLAKQQARSGPPGPPGSRHVPGGERITVVVPVFLPRARHLERCIESVVAQTYPNWELCLCDDASGDFAVTQLLQSAARRDSRIRVAALETNSGISAATNRAASLGTGTLVAFLDHDDELHPDALARVAEVVASAPETDVVYTDEDKLDERDRRCQPTFKPDWSADWLMSTAYMCHLLVVRRSVLDEVGGLRAEFDGSQDYDLMLRATERARAVAHIPEVLYHWRMVAGSAAEDSGAKPWAHDASRLALEAALERRGEGGRVDDGPYAGIYHVRRALRSKPLVSVVIPFRNEAAMLRRCVDSVLELAGYDNLEVLLVDNDSEDPEIAALLGQLRQRRGIEVIASPGRFNWSRINNEAVRHSTGEVLLFLNNDVEAISHDWLLAMLEHAQRPEVAAVGARLLYPDGRLQHAGIIVGLYGKTGHILQGILHYDPGYMGMAKLTRNFSAVTGACMMTRRSVFEQLGGFDESMAVGYSDVDYCLKATGAGYSIVYTPLAELVHSESHSRGLHDDSRELAAFLDRWGEAVERGDPYFNPNLSRDSGFCQLPVENKEREWYAR